jgi:hypothetical protein
MAAQQARIAMVETDPNHSPVALQKEKDKLLEIERKYEQSITALRTKAAVEDRAYATQFGNNLASSFSSLIQRFAQGTLSVKGLLIGMGQAVLGSFTQIFADIAARWLASQIMQRIGGKPSRRSDRFRRARLRSRSGGVRVDRGHSDHWPGDWRRRPAMAAYAGCT